MKPTVAVVLTEFNRPVFYDRLLPLGRLRESIKALSRADMVIVTKCPDKLKPVEYRIFKNNLKVFPYQKLFFSRYEYMLLQPLFPDEADPAPYLSWLNDGGGVLLLSGIANPRPLVRYLRSFHAPLKVKSFPDHHAFTRRDMESLRKEFDQMEGERRIIVTTEKDAVRLAGNPYFPQELKRDIYYLPIEVRFDTRFSENFQEELRPRG